LRHLRLRSLSRLLLRPQSRLQLRPPSRRGRLALSHFGQIVEILNLIIAMSSTAATASSASSTHDGSEEKLTGIPDAPIRLLRLPPMGLCVPIHRPVFLRSPILSIVLLALPTSVNECCEKYNL
jgi:hypothetical protein